MKSNDKTIIIGIIAVIVVTVIVSVSYAYFLASVTGNDDANQTVVQTGDLELTFTDTDIINLPEVLPGTSATKVFTIENTGSVEVSYEINLINVINEFINNELVYSISSTNNGGTVTETPVPITDGTLLRASIAPDVTQTYTLIIEFKETGSNQNSNQGAVFTGKLEVTSNKEYVQTYSVKDMILRDNNEISDASVNFANTSETNGDAGLYYTADATTYGEDGQRIYYYRGDINNNWVSFGGYYWRIVRTTAEGGVKLVYSGGNTTTGPSSLTTTSGIMTGNFNASNSNIYYMGYTYNTNLNQWDGMQTNSNAKTIIDNWYASSSLTETDRTYLSETAVYCNDRSSNRVDGNNVYYPAYDRLYSDKRPTFVCNKANGSRYTKTANSANGNNGYLTYPIAMLSADEVAYAGLLYDSSRSIQGVLTPYIMDNAISFWWTMSPYGWNGSYSILFNTYELGYLFYSGVANQAVFIRPAVSLKSCIIVSGGNGSKELPYTLSNSEC